MSDENKTLGDSSLKYERDLNTIKLSNQDEKRSQPSHSEKRAELYEHMDTDVQVREMSLSRFILSCFLFTVVR